MSKKSRKRNKKILAVLAAGLGAAALAKGKKGAVTGVVNPNLSKASVAADVATDVATDVGSGGTDKFLPRVHPGTLLNQRKKIPGYGTAVAPPGILNPYRHGAISGRAQRKGGGIAKRGTGVALKKGGRVTGIAKRGFGRALMKGKK